MASILDRYSSAVNSKSLRPSADKGVANQTLDVDYLGAMGLASKITPLGVNLQRLFSGDNRAAYAIVETLADMAWHEARHLKVKLNRWQANDMAKACLAWHRNGTCKPCGGHGYEMIPGVPSLSSHQCQVCKGTGKILFEEQFPYGREQLARWLLSEMTREAGKAGPEAMKALAPRLDF